ncbi:hypothetical protein F7725_025110 [Dissostichus mawsoni]|uniref:Uncharacterized protein n=1 Tax=Dissostichus mawsoni TaxID=36200 RepID=A0A7J5XA75_DISMA|nr:hypothetical protein F7725_025110 [Dissostichus mawsoni]
MHPSFTVHKAPALSQLFTENTDGRTDPCNEEVQCCKFKPCTDFRHYHSVYVCVGMCVGECVHTQKQSSNTGLVGNHTLLYSFLRGNEGPCVCLAECVCECDTTMSSSNPCKDANLYPCLGGHISTPGAKNYFKPPSSNTHVKLRLDTAHSFHFSFRSVVEDFETKLVGGMSQTAGKTKQQAGTCKDYTLIMWKADTATGATAASQ